jgi:hypothetical protein
LSSLFDPDDRRSISLRDVVKLPPDYTASHLRRRRVGGNYLGTHIQAPGVPLWAVSRPSQYSDSADSDARISDELEKIWKEVVVE